MKVCEQVRVLNFGQTLFTGKPAELAHDPAVVAAYFGEDYAAA
jgi:ABC-type branched-subunit amino acid transport system ATPase component